MVVILTTDWKPISQLDVLIQKRGPGRVYLTHSDATPVIDVSETFCIETSEVLNLPAVGTLTLWAKSTADGEVDLVATEV